jgi:integrase
MPIKRLFSMTALVTVSSLVHEHLLTLADNHVIQKNNLLNAHDDITAISRWLEEFRLSIHTYRAYEKESLRFLYWLYVAQKITLNEARKQHIHDYRVFLMDPQPAEFWCAPLGDRRNSRKKAQWMPFSGPLKLRSIQAAMTILNGMFTYLLNAQYLSSNPFSLIKQRLVEKFDVESRKIDIVERMLSKEEFHLLIQAIELMHQRQLKAPAWIERSYFIFYFLAYLGLRVGELVSHHWTDFLNMDGKWWLTILGKGKKLARVPVNNQCLVVINNYRQSLGLCELNRDRLTADPLICKLNKNNTPVLQEGVTERSIHLILKEVALFAAEQTDNRSLQEKFKRFSPHWLRHFSASMQAQADIPFEFIKAHHRHSKDETTRLYIHHEDHERHDWSQNLDLKQKK